jgi:Tol biopolymer transport system component
LRRLTDNGWWNANPSWSPDGTKVAFESAPPSSTTEHSEIYTINADGTGEKALTNNQTVDVLPEWSPDGRRIVFQSYSAINVMNANGTEQRRVQSGGTLQLPGTDPLAWSPDGKKIALVTTDDEIATINPDGTRLASITRTPYLSVWDPNWQPLPEPTPPKSRSLTVHPPDTGGPPLLLVASALLFCVGVLLNAVVKRMMEAPRHMN